MHRYGIQVYRPSGHNCVCTYLNCAFSRLTLETVTVCGCGWRRVQLLLFLSTVGVYQTPITVMKIKSRVERPTKGG